VVVLDEVIREAHGLELILPKSLHEEAAAILENIGHEDDNFSEMPRFDSNVHMTLRTGITAER
jgi:hypothetical protein